MPRKTWGPKVRRGRTIPFGYKVSDYDPQILEPIPSELKALDKAIQYYRNGTSSQQECVDWLKRVTGRHITRRGLFDVILVKRRKSLDRRIVYQPESTEASQTKTETGEVT